MRTAVNNIKAEVVNAVNSTVKSNATPKFEEARVSENFENIVKNLCKKHGQAGNPDWRQEMEISLWEATEKHAPERGDFWSYAYFVLSTTAIRLAAKDRLVTIGYDYVCGTHDKEIVRTSSVALDESNINTLGDDYLVDDATDNLALNEALSRLTATERWLVKAKSGLIKTESGSENLNVLAAEIGIPTTVARRAYQRAIDKMSAMLGC